MQSLEGMDVLWLLAGILALYVLVSIGYRRYLFKMLPEEIGQSPEAETPADAGEFHCPHCGALNDVDFDRCGECAQRLPSDPPEEGSA